MNSKWVVEDNFEYEFGISYKFCEPNVGFFFFPTFSRLVLVFSLWFFVRCPIFVLLLSETKTSFSETAKFFKSWWLMRRISSLLDDDGGDSSETIPSSSVLSSVFDSLSGISPKKNKTKKIVKLSSFCKLYNYFTRFLKMS